MAAPVAPRPVVPTQAAPPSPPAAAAAAQPAPAKPAAPDQPKPPDANLGEPPKAPHEPGFKSSEVEDKDVKEGENEAPGEWFNAARYACGFCLGLAFVFAISSLLSSTTPAKQNVDVAGGGPSEVVTRDDMQGDNLTDSNISNIEAEKTQQMMLGFT